MPKSYAAEDDKDMRCPIDNLFGCEHIRKQEKQLSIPMPKASKLSYPIRVEENKVRIATDEEVRILIPPVVRTPNISTVLRATEDKKEAPDTFNIVCQVCQVAMTVDLITAHLKEHMDEYQPTIAKPTEKQTAALATTHQSETSHLPKKIEVPLVRVSSKEQYHHREIQNISFSSSTGRNGRYSDFSIILWEPAKSSINDHTYASHNYTASTSTDIRRFHIVITYDALDDYYHLSAKLLKKVWYNESDEGAIPDRICESPKELFVELRRALIYFRINPRVVYRLFRKMQRRDEFVSEYDKDGRAIATQTSNTDRLLEQLKNTYKTDSTYNSHHYGNYH